MDMTGAVPSGKSRAQLLDSLEVERSRGITVKAQTVSLFHRDEATGELYLLNLIDTPGHVDFSYEVSRSIAACQGALLLVDCTKGVQAQTVANFWLAFEQELSILPIVNKVDLPHANVAGALEQMQSAFDLEPADALCISAKTGVGTDALIPRLLERVPPPTARAEAPLRVLLFDSWYDDFRGVLCLVQVLDGELRLGHKLVSAATGKEYVVTGLELMRPLGMRPLPSLGPGTVGCAVLGMKAISEACVGDTLCEPHAVQPPLPGFRRPQPTVFAGLFPTSEDGFDELQHAMGRFLLKDGSVSVETDHSNTLGRGLRCGFLGMLHMEVVQQRLRQEHGVEVLVTAPTVPLRATMGDGTQLPILSPEAIPRDFHSLTGRAAAAGAARAADPQAMVALEEPLVSVTLLAPSEHVGALISECEARSGVQASHSYLGADRAMLKYTLPLAEIATDFHDTVKSLSNGFASLDYEAAGHQPADIVVLGLRINGADVDALSRIVRRAHALPLAREMVSSMKAEMEREIFDVVIQAVANGSRVLARETIKATRKNVLAKCYGGDISRKKKLLNKQKEGKKRRAIQAGPVQVPQEAFLAVLAPGAKRRR